ncbi:zinc finger BED domain-containing protein RICESLEEPER 2-like [Senna tora]|uniref:Zinc finger BED domain-containing protein RICESLEEPER 2-like n=1 Tax=Senna tora TaxID=362788 RepID=A0A834TIB0_9FABA|nr:zinc finger BED domain-containing protein RICESLEEPER 2-like [Senna tora]
METPNPSVINASNVNDDGDDIEILEKKPIEKGKAIIEHDLPYSFVDYKGIRKWIKYLNPDVIMPSRNTVVSDVKKIYEKEKEKLKQEMARIPNRVCFTSDVWTACTSEEGLKVASDALHKIRESVKYVKASYGRMQKFDDCVRESGGVETGLGLRLDVTTRWNSTYLMLESVLYYQKAFTRLNLIDRNYKYCPSVEEWRRATKMREFLEPFFETTNLISGSKYPTSNLYFMQVWKIECMLNASLTNEDEVIRDMAHRMKVKFGKYWSEYSEVLAFGAILDPRRIILSEHMHMRFCIEKTLTHGRLIFERRRPTVIHVFVHRRFGRAQVRLP